MTPPTVDRIGYIQANYPKFWTTLERLRARHGKLSIDNLNLRFLPYYERDDRIRVRHDSMPFVYYGTVSTSTGWAPVFLLLKGRQRSSSFILDRHVEITGVRVKQRSVYQEVKDSGYQRERMADHPQG